MQQELLPHAKPIVEQLEKAIAQKDEEVAQLDEQRKKKRAEKTQLVRSLRALTGEKKPRKPRASVEGERAPSAEAA